MRRFLAIAMLIGFIAPASAERGFINGFGKNASSFVSDGSKATTIVPTERQKKFFQDHWAQRARADRAAELRRAQENINQSTQHAQQKADQAQMAAKCGMLGKVTEGLARIGACR